MAIRYYDMIDYIKIITDMSYPEIIYILNSKLKKDISDFVACKKYGNINDLGKEYIIIIISLKEKMSLSKIAIKFNDTNVNITPSDSNTYVKILKRSVFEYGFTMPNYGTLKYIGWQ